MAATGPRSSCSGSCRCCPRPCAASSDQKKKRLLSIRVVPKDRRRWTRQPQKVPRRERYPPSDFGVNFRYV